MRNKIRVILVVAVICTTLGMGACKYFSPLIDYYGIVLSTDGSGHLNEDITYTWGSSRLTLFATGAYEYYEESFEDTGEDSDGDGTTGEGWVKTYGEKGTYTWDAETFISVFIITQTISSGEWTNLTNQVTQTRSYYFSDRNFGTVWRSGQTFIFDTASGTGWGYRTIDETADTSTITRTYIMVPNEETGVARYYYHYEYKDNTGTVTSESETLRDGTYTTNPANANLEKAGERFKLIEKVTSTYTDDLATENNDAYYRTWDFVAGGSTALFSGITFWIEWPGDAALRAVIRP